MTIFMSNGLGESLHQLLSLRPFYDKKRERWDKTDTRHFKEKWGAGSIKELFTNLAQHIEKIPQGERFNFYYTVAFCAEGKREFREQREMVFDIDGLGELAAKPPAELSALYLPIVAHVLGVPPEKFAVVFSGNGLHFLISLLTPIVEPAYFDTNRRHYAALCEKLDLALGKAGLPGKLDPAVFDPRRIMRLPGTLNKKEGKPERMAVLLQNGLDDVDWSLSAASGLPQISASEQIPAANLKQIPTDTDAVLQGCEFLKWCKTSPNEVRESQWYAMLSVIPRLPPNGRTLAHEYSQEHSSYSFGETEAKIDQALQASGPRTCSNINGLWGKCASCKFNGKVNSPIMIRGEKFIKTKDTGFHEVTFTKEGLPRVGKPQFEDLRLFFETDHQYIILGESGICLTWNGKFWEEYADKYLENFAQTHFDPTADTKMTSEFRNLVCRTNLRRTSWFVETTNRKMNFRNGVLDLETMTLKCHSVEYGFRYVLDYDYDAKAKAPEFEKFMLSVMAERQDLVDTLLEFAGYAFSGDECWADMALILTGEGSNGKSTFMQILKSLAGSDNCSTLSSKDIQSETARKMLDGSLFNLAEETPTHAFSESSLFKNLVAGGDTTVKVLYKQPYSIANKTKFIFACNELPRTKDTTRGYFRRLLIVPFDKSFEGSAKDPFIKEKVMSELPGIFNLVIQGYHRLKKRRMFREDVAAIKRELDEYQLELDSVRSWFEDCVKVGPADSGPEQTVSALYASYVIYAESRGEKPEVQTTLARRVAHILKRQGDLEVRKGRKMFRGRKERTYKGITLNDGAEY